MPKPLATGRAPSLGDRFYDNTEVVAIFKEYGDVLGDAVPRANKRGRAVMDELIWRLQPGDAELIDAWSDANAGKLNSAGKVKRLDWLTLPRRADNQRILFRDFTQISTKP